MQVQKFAEIILDPNFTPEKNNNKTIFQNNFLRMHHISNSTALRISQQ
jgi:hypothetical protein